MLLLSELSTYFSEDILGVTADILHIVVCVYVPVDSLAIAASAK